MTIEDALAKVADLQGKLATATAEVERLREHKTTLESDLKQTRDKRGELETQVNDLKGKVPQADSVVLSQDDAKALEAYRELGDLKAIKGKLDAYPELEGDLRAYKRREAITKLAGERYNAAALYDELPADLEVEEKQDGDTVSYQLKQGDKTRPVDEVVAELKAKKPYVVFDNQPAGVRVMPQAGARQPATQDHLSRFIAARNAQHTPKE